MVDKYTRDKLYDYQTVKEIFLNSQNANLVVSRPRETPRENEPSGEAETLGGKFTL